MLGTTASIANDLTHGVQVKDKLDGVFFDHQPKFINLCDFFDM